MSLKSWNPIESAPRETPIWLALADGNVMLGECVFADDAWYWAAGYGPWLGKDGKWQFTDSDMDDYSPVAWLPLPEPYNARNQRPA